MERCETRDIEGKATRAGASKPGGERVSIKKQTGETEQRIRKPGIQERMQASQFPYPSPISTSGLQNSTEFGTNGRSLPMKPTTRLFFTSIAAGCAAVLISCAGTQTMSQNR